MNNVCKDIFRAIHEGKWLYIEYKNKKDETTKYWVGIKEVDVNRKSLQVDGLHLGSLQCTSLFVYIESIVASAVIEGSYQPVNCHLVQDLALYPEKYDSIFHNTANLKILNYLADCNKLDCTPYNSNYSLVEKLDLDVLNPNGHILSDEQFKTIVASFQKKTTDEKNIKKGWFVQLGMNVLSINHKDY